MQATLRKKDYAAIARQLREHLVGRFADVTVEIGDDIHYKGVNIVVTTRVFEGLLPEQRYHHVVHAVPPDLYEKHLRSGVVWFELAPGQTGREYMKMPRSEDVADDAAKIEARLAKAGFFERFAEAVDEAGELSRDDFVLAKRLLAESGAKTDEVQRATLYFVLRGAFCDADLPGTVLATPDDDDED